MEKKYKEVSKARMDTFVLLSSLGMRSRFSKSVRVAVATIPKTEINFSQGMPEVGFCEPDWIAAWLTSIKNT